MRPVDAIRHILTRRATPRLPALCRIVVGAAAVLEIATTSTWVVQFFTHSEFVPARNFEWLPDPGPSGALALVALGLAGAMGFCVGFLTRTSGIAVAATIGYRLAYDQNLYSNHAYLLVLVVSLLVLADAGSAFSLDSKLGWRRSSDIPDWPLTLVRIQISLVYLFTALAKMNPIFLAGGVLLHQSRLPAIIPSFRALVLLSWIVVGWEMFQAVALWSRRLRGFAFASGIAFHTAAVLVLERFPSAGLTVFCLVMTACYLLFAEVPPRATGEGSQKPDWLSRQLTSRLSAPSETATCPET